MLKTKKNTFLKVLRLKLSDFQDLDFHTSPAETRFVGGPFDNRGEPLPFFALSIAPFPTLSAMRKPRSMIALRSMLGDRRPFLACSGRRCCRIEVRGEHSSLHACPRKIGTRLELVGLGRDEWGARSCWSRSAGVHDAPSTHPLWSLVAWHSQKHANQHVMIHSAWRVPSASLTSSYSTNEWCLI
jgi:hypothetical protein